jgi:hypothetical protein
MTPTGKRRLARVSAVLMGSYLALGPMIEWLLHSQNPVYLPAFFGPVLLGILLGWQRARTLRRPYTVPEVWVWGMSGAFVCTIVTLGVAIVTGSTSGSPELRDISYATALGFAWAGLQGASGAALFVYGFGGRIQGPVKRRSPRHLER